MNLRSQLGAVRNSILIGGAILASSIVIIAPFVGGGGGAPSGTANLWIDSNGGSCTRQGTAGSYVDAQACSDAQAALNAASCGDRVRYVDGTYSVQNITSSSKSCSTSTRVIFSPDNDTPNVYGTPSDTIIHGINADAQNCWCRFQDFDTYVDNTTNGTLHAATGGTIGSELPHADPITGGGSGQAFSSSWASFVRIDATNSYYAASDVEQIGGSIGGYDSCNGGAHLDQDATKIWGANNQISNRVTINGTLYHDIHHTCGAEHIDMMQIGGGIGTTIENVRGYNLPDQGIFSRPYAGLTSESTTDLRILNNMIGSWTTDDVNGSGSTSIGICNSGDNCTSVDVENNTVAGGIDVFPGGRTIVNNYATGGYTNVTDGSNIMANNAYATINPPNGINVKHCTPTFTTATATAEATANFHLSASDTCLRDQGNASAFASPDLDGDTRPQGPAPDIGADEYVPPGNALSFNGTSGQQATYPAVDLSNTAYTFVVAGHMTADNTTDAFATSETSAHQVVQALERVGSDGPSPTTGVVANAIDLYRHTTNDDHVWTDPLSLTQSTGDFVLFVSKINGGGTCSPTNQGDASCPQVHLYHWTGSAWAQVSGSPTPMIYQLGNGNSPGAGGVTKIGNFGGSGDQLHANIDLEAIYTTQLSGTQIDTIMAAHSTAAMLAQSPAWLVDFKDGLTNDLSGNGKNRSGLVGATTTTPFTSAEWTAG